MVHLSLVCKLSPFLSLINVAILNQAITILYSTMLWSSRYLNCFNSLCALLISSQPRVGAGFVPRDVAAGETIERRLCDPAAPDVSESSVRLLRLALGQFLLT